MTHEGMWRIYSNPDPHGSIGEKRAEKLLNLQKENRALTVEDVKMLTRIPSTIWDPFVEQEVIKSKVPHMEPSVELLTSEVKELRKLRI
jgi:hypothetical protein